MDNEVTWWEKTVEYTFLLRFAANTGRQVWPLGGKAELMGDTIYSLEKVSWGLFEFKRDKTSLKTELGKFAVDTEEYKNARLRVRELSKALEAARTAHSVHHVSPVSNAGIQDVEEPEHSAVKIAEQAYEGARLTLANIQTEAFTRAQVFFEKKFPKPTYHFLVYGGKIENKPAIALYSKPYFDLLKKSDTGDAIVTDALDAFVKWDKKSFAEYLREFMNFKRFGLATAVEGGASSNGGGAGNVDEAVAASDMAHEPAKASGGSVSGVSGRNSDSKETKDWQVGEIRVGDDPTYIIGVDEERIIVAPFDKSEATLRLLNYISHLPKPAPTPPGAPPQNGIRPKGSTI